MRSPPLVLFVCVQNAGRSQMAEALLRLRSGGRVEVRSGGTEPADAIQEGVVAAMAEIGVDLSGYAPKLVDADDVREADIVVTMSCCDACPLYPGKLYMDWKVEDTYGKGLVEVRRVRDEIDRRISGIVGALLARVS